MTHGSLTSVNSLGLACAYLVNRMDSANVSNTKRETESHPGLGAENSSMGAIFSHNNGPFRATNDRMNLTRESAEPAATFTQRRLAREWKTVTAMVRIHCRDHHGRALCGECEDLLGYVRLRLDRCRFGEDKPPCAKCPVHCYQRDRRQQIQEVMRYAGPRMVWQHPWLSLRHLLDGAKWRRPPAQWQQKAPDRPLERSGLR